MTSTITFQPTFLQKFLGRNYKWWYILRYEIKRSTVYIFNDYLSTLTHYWILDSQFWIKKL